MSAVTQIAPSSNPTDAQDAAVAALAAHIAELTRTMSIARALASVGRQVDLSGLDAGVGLACAKALDLPYEDGRACRVWLIELRDELDTLSAALRAKPPA